jgi:hypothetical protein
VLLCGAGRHRFPPRVGEVFHDGLMVKPTHALERRPVVLQQGPQQYGPPPRSVRFPCGGRLEGDGRCRADWNVEPARLQAAYRRAIEAGRRTLVLGVDL